jgi:hypothetical protein
MQQTSVRKFWPKGSFQVVLTLGYSYRATELIHGSHSQFFVEMCPLFASKIFHASTVSALSAGSFRVCQ